MMSNLVTKILYQKRRFMIGWFVGLFALSLFLMLLFPALQKSEIGQLFSNLSPALQKIAGGQDSFSTVDKYIGGELFALRMPLLFIILSIILFASITVGDERRGALMTQLTMPISRARLLGEKLLAVGIILLVVTVGMLLGVLLGAAIIHDPVNIMEMLKHTVGCLLIGLDFGLIVFLLGGGFGKRGSATAIATAVAFMSYLVSSLVAVASVLEPFEKFSLFHYYQNPSPVSVAHAGLLVLVGAIMIAASFVAFPRRDIG
jgi:ABC-2 type transport system permease protein